METKKVKTIKNKWRNLVGCGMVIASLGACGDLLDVSDPSRFTDADLDQALQAVVNGVEGELHIIMDGLINDAEIIADVMQHTGTWAGWDDTDHGLIRYDNDGRSDGGAGLLRARFGAQDAMARFTRLGNVDATFGPIVQTVEGWANLVLAGQFCEAPDDPITDAAGVVTGGAVLTDTQLWQKARDQLALAGTAAGAAGATDYQHWANAGLARAELMLGNYTAAAAAASTIPVGWEKLALYQQSTAENSIVNLSTAGFNEASGIREKWWAQVDDAAGMMRDQFTNELDSRVEITHTAGVLGVDGVTEHYSQFKYKDVGDDIRFTHYNEMQLILAEVQWRAGNLAPAMVILNALRAGAGLSAATATTTQAVQDVLLNERFAELFMEGQRMNDLDRFNLTAGMLAAGDFAGSIPNRAIKFPMASAEAINNPNIEDDASIRCTPTT
jgi:hypothetical protein